MAYSHLPEELPIGTLLAKRYTIVEKLGAGGFGAVYAAEDSLLKQRVAVKVMQSRGARDKEQFGSEVSLLRLLRLPNLISLIDDGEFGELQFLVTDIVQGARFPGLKPRPSWEDLEYTTLRLLEALARVHSYGVVHRDLKPSNVFVDATGEPTVLDFGVSFGPGFRRDKSGRIVGTPAFLAPEQAAGQRGDARSDLYALGVMVYEALSGRLPHRADSLEELMAAKVHKPPVPLRNVAPHVPPNVAFAIDALLRTEPHLRPPNATVALEFFGVPRSSLKLPWLGSRAAVDRAVSLLASGQSFVTEGNSGLGHTRLLEEVAQVIEASGGEAWLGGHADYPWGSLPHELLARIERIADAKAADIVELLRDAAADGVVLLMDDAPLMDEHTRRAVHQSGIPTAWVAEAASLPSVRLDPLPVSAVEPLFHGPELIVHLRGDAAELAVRLSEGRPRALTAQLDGWVKAGIGYWDHGKLRVTREALDRIDAGLDVVPPEADAKQMPPSFYATLAQHDSGDIEQTLAPSASDPLSAMLETRRPSIAERELSLSTTLQLSEDTIATLRDDPNLEIAYSAPPGARGRFLRLIRAGALDDVVQEALWLAQQGQSTGNLRHAFAALREALSLVRTTERRGYETMLLRQITLVALELQGARERDLALYELEQGRDGSPTVESLAELLHFVRLIRQNGGGGERAVLSDTSRRLMRDDPDLERWRWGGEAMCALRESPQSGLQFADEYLAWAQQVGHRNATSSAMGVRGFALYALRRFEDAAEQHAGAAAIGHGTPVRAVAYSYAASCWLEAGKRDEALAAAAASLVHANAGRLAHVGVRALWLHRAIALRFGDSVQRDDEVMEFYESMASSPEVTSNAWLVEAAISWRLGDLDGAAACAEQARASASAAGAATVELLARCLAVAAGARDEALARELPLRAAELPFPRLKSQAFALYLQANPQDTWAQATLHGALQEANNEPNRTPIWEVLTPDECARSLAVPVP